VRAAGGREKSVHVAVHADANDHVNAEQT